MTVLLGAFKFHVTIVYFKVFYMLSLTYWNKQGLLFNSIEHSGNIDDRFSSARKQLSLQYSCFIFFLFGVFSPHQMYVRMDVTKLLIPNGWIQKLGVEKQLWKRGVHACEKLLCRICDIKAQGIFPSTYLELFVFISVEAATSYGGLAFKWTLTLNFWIHYYAYLQNSI